MSDNKVFDTSVLAYAYNESEPEKRKRTIEIVARIYEGREKGAVTNQILAELFNVLTRHTKPFHMDKEVAESLINDFISSNNWTKIDYTSETIRNAMHKAKLYNAPFWDMLIAQTMEENFINTIVTENERDFKKVPGIKIINPFKLL